VFVPRKFQARAVAKIGGDLWGYLAGGREQTDYYLGADGTPCEAVAELHGRLWARLGLARLDRVAFGRLTAGCHPLTGQRLVKTSHITNLDLPGLILAISLVRPVSLVDATLTVEWRRGSPGN
jgi:hypothetical protein